LARPTQPAFRAYDGNRVLFTEHAKDEQQALEVAMERCLDDGLGYLAVLHVAAVDDQEVKTT
jgi:hypothetical protein